ncbi:hypothetical protein IPdc08_00376 [archaeon]|nr:hypothetical protein IPdc08_00376 [archaeon]
MISLSPSLAYYYYFYSEDQEDIFAFIKGLKESYDLKNKKKVFSELKDYSSFRLIASAGKENIILNTLILKDITLLELIVSLPEEEWGEFIKNHIRIKEPLQDQLKNFLGEGILLVTSPGGEIPKKVVERLDIITEYIITELEVGRLYLLKSWGKEYNIYGFIPESDYEEFIFGALPYINLYVHFLETKVDFYIQKGKYMKEKRHEINIKVGEIFGRTITLFKNPQKRQMTLEKEIDELSNVYSSLALNVSYLKSSLVSMDTDIRKLESKIESLLSPGGQNGLNSELKRYKDIRAMLKEEEEFSLLTLEEVKEAIDVVRTRVELLNSKEALDIQKQGFNLQVSAGVIEVIIVYYYTLNIWRILSPGKVFQNIPYYYRFYLVLLFSLFVLTFTHYSVHAMAEKKLYNKGMIVSVIAGLLIISTIYLITFAH